MLRISLSGLWYHKKLSAFYALLLALSLALILTVFPLFDSVIDGIAATGAAKYGKHDSIVYNLSEEQLSALRKNLLARKVGVLETYGSWTLAGTTQAGSITIGSFDETAWQLGCIPILDGRLPERADEIALEQNVRFRLGREFAVGDSLTLEQGGATRTFTVCGILANYTNNWDTPTGNPLVAGYNDLPKGIVALQQTNMPVRHLHALCLSDTIGGPIAQFAEENGLDSSGSGQYYYLVLYEQLKPLKSFRRFFFLIIAFGVVLCLYKGLSLYLDAYQAAFQTMIDLGARRAHLFRIFAVQQGVLLLLGALLGLPLGAGIAWFADRRLAGHAAIDLFSVQSLCTLGIALLFLAALAAACFSLRFRAEDGSSLSRRKRKRSKPMRISGSLLGSLGMHFVDTGLRRVLPILLLVACLFSLTSFSEVYIQDFLETNVFQALLEERPDLWWPAFFVNSIRMSAYATFETVHLYQSKNRAFPKQIVQEFYADAGVDFIYVDRYATNEATLLVPQGDPYWYSFDVTGYGDAELGFPSSAIAGVPQDVLSACYGFYVLDDVVTPAFLEACPELADAIASLGRDEVIAIFPPTEDGRQNTSLAVGDALTFAELTYTSDDFNEVWHNPSLITYVEHPLSIASIYPDQLQFHVGRRTQQITGPTFLITEETFLENDLFHGVEGFSIYLSPDISEADYAAVERHVMQTASAMDNASVVSRREQAAQDAQFMAVTSTSLAITLGVLGLFSLFCLALTLYMALMQRKRSLAILRGLGMRRRTLEGAIFLELLVYLLYCLVSSILLYFLFMFFFHREIFLSIVTWENTRTMLRTLGGCLLAVLALCGVLMRFLSGSLYREEVSTALRTAE